MKKETDGQAKSPEKKRKSHVGKIILLLFVLIIAAGAVMHFKVPQKIGLVKSPAEKLFTVTPDGEKAALVMDGLTKAGLNTKGVEVYVMPVSGTDDNVALVVLDASRGFSFNSSSSSTVKDFLKVISAAQQQGINRAAVSYYDESGKELATATVPTNAVVAYSQGKLTDSQLMEKVDVGAGDLVALIKQIQQQLK